MMPVVRKDILIAVVAVLVIAAVAFGLSTVSRDLPLTPSAPVQAEKTSEKKVAATDKIVMHVNGEPVTEREFAAFLAAAPQQARALYASPAGRRAIAGEMVKVKVLEQEARRRGIDKDPEVQTQANFMRAQIEAGRALEKIIEERSEQKIRAQYAAQKNNWFVLRHIAIAYQGSQIPPRSQQQPAPTPQQAMAKAQDIVKRLRAGADFTRAAVAESDDVQSAQQGGVLGPVTPDRLGDLGPAVAKLPIGQISDPVQSPLAVHIFRKDEASIEDLRPALLQEVRQQVAQEEIARLEKSAKVDLDPKFFPEPPKGSAPNPMQ